MAPTTTTEIGSQEPQQSKSVLDDIELDWKKLYLSKEERDEWFENYEYKDFFPSYPDISWGPTETFDYEEKALLADPNNNYANLLKGATSIKHISPKIGTIIYGVSLSNLNDTQKNELALLIARRQVVVFKKQTDLDVQSHINLIKYYGPLHRHLVSGLAKGWDKGNDVLHLIFSDNYEGGRDFSSGSRNLWHSDVTYEIQPTGYSSIKMLKAPKHGGGDTLFTSGYSLYDSLSPAYRDYLSKLTASNSSQRQANDARTINRPVRREPITTSHPLVRTNPATGLNSVYLSQGFFQKVDDVPPYESDNILKFITELIATQQNSTIRVQYEDDDVVFWDNRSTYHAATYDHWPQLRHGYRISAQAERPIVNPNGKSQRDTILEAIGEKRVNTKEFLKSNNYR